MEVGMTMDSKLVHFQKARFPIVVTDAGMTTDCKPLQSRAVRAPAQSSNHQQIKHETTCRRPEHKDDIFFGEVRRR